MIFTIINSDEIKDLEIKKDEQEVEVLKKFFNLFEKTGINTALRIKSNINDRLSVIKKLENFIDEEEIEKVFEEHLAKHPWLINPYWDLASKKIILTTQDFYKKIINENTIIGYTDIIVRLAEEAFPIICELKRSKKQVTQDYRQVKLFHKLINIVV